MQLGQSDPKNGGHVGSQALHFWLSSWSYILPALGSPLNRGLPQIRHWILNTGLRLRRLWEPCFFSSIQYYLLKAHFSHSVRCINPSSVRLFEDLPRNAPECCTLDNRHGNGKSRIYYSIYIIYIYIYIIIIYIYILLFQSCIIVHHIYVCPWTIRQTQRFQQPRHMKDNSLNFAEPCPDTGWIQWQSASKTYPNHSDSLSIPTKIRYLGVWKRGIFTNNHFDWKNM